MMPNTSLTILCLALIGATVATPLAPVAKINADNGVLNMLAEANALGGSADPEITTECFNYYMPILNQLSTNFSVQYEQCVSVATKATANLTASAAQSRLSLVNETDAICNSFTACNSDNDTLDFFNCYATASSADILEVYTLSDSASNAAIALKGGLEQIKNVENSCTNNAQNNYILQTSETYKKLYACFVDGLPSSSTGATPSSTVSTVSTAATTSSAAPATA
ncbi:uncharacterized protein LOC101449679 [Ceratitis capitata]|uniref:uncharacterized protein LOC101449679 n=1 Tax=Ceratitis capitata TaxID=7213 RepID=UPI000A0FA6A5|nr:uncharacterized protein LOC101449679 [Ceratitis capitata]